MKIARRLFISSAIFALVIDVVYYFVAHEPAGITLLSFLTVGLTVIAVYMFVTERSANLLADKQDATRAEARGEHVGTFILNSPAPFWIALGIFGGLLGLIVAPQATGLGLVALLFLGALMIVRSR